MSELREHVREMHPRLRMRRKNADLAHDHAREHHRFALGHFHAGSNTGADDRPPGWYTGADAVPKEGKRS